MISWTPEAVFACTWLAAAVTGMSIYLGSDAPFTFRGLLTAIFFYGGLGCGFGMVGYGWLGGKDEPWRVIGCGFLVGVRAISIKGIKTILQRLLGHDVD